MRKGDSNPHGFPRQILSRGVLRALEPAAAILSEAEGSLSGVWCERGDSNPHGFPRQILSLTPAFPNSLILLHLQNVSNLTM